MALSLWYFCDLRTSHPESADLFRRAVEALQCLPPDEETDIALGLMLAFQAWFTAADASLAHQGEAFAEKSLAILRRYDCPQETVFALVCLANTKSFMLGEYKRAEQAAREGLAIAQEHRTQWGLGPCLVQLSNSLQSQGDVIQARQVADACREVG